MSSERTTQLLERIADAWWEHHLDDLPSDVVDILFEEIVILEEHIKRQEKKWDLTQQSSS